MVPGLVVLPLDGQQDTQVSVSFGTGNGDAASYRFWLRPRFCSLGPAGATSSSPVSRSLRSPNQGHPCRMILASSDCAKVQQRSA